MHYTGRMKLSKEKKRELNKLVDESSSTPAEMEKARKAINTIVKEIKRAMASMEGVSVDRVFKGTPRTTFTRRARNTQHATRNTQHATRNTQHATRNTQHATRSTQHAARTTHHAPRTTPHACTQYSTRSVNHASHAPPTHHHSFIYVYFRRFMEKRNNPTRGL